MPDKSKTLTTIFAARDNVTKAMHSMADAGEKATQKVSELQKILKNNFYSKEAETCAEKLEKAFEKAERGSVASIGDIETAIEKGFREASKDITTTADRIQKLESELADSKKRVTELEDAIEKLGNSSDDTDKKISGMGDSLKGVTGLLKGAAAAAGAYIGISTINESINNELKAVNQFQARVGSSIADMSKYKSSMDSIYRNGMGESIEDVANSMATVKVNTGLDGSELESTTNNALLLRDVFDFDVSESTRAAKMMMDQFGVSGQTAYNLIAQGAQNGLDKNGDLLDTINEYSVHFEQLGFDAEDMFNMLVNGAESGTFSVDKLGDTIKEFGIRAIDGSDTTKTGFEAIGLSADTMAEKFAAGGESAKAAFAETIEAIKNVEDPIAQNTAGVNLFGTMWEDLGAKGVIALSDINGKISETSTALEDINDIKYQDLGSTFETVSRSLMGELTDGLMGNTDNIISEFRDMETKLQPVFRGIGEGIGDVLEDVPDMLETVGSGIEFVTEHSTEFKTVAAAIISMFAANKAIKGITDFSEALSKSLNATTVFSSTTSKVGGVVSKFASGLSGAALPLTVATGAVTAVVAGVKAYDEYAKNSSLEEHFGDITLSISEMEKMADKVVTGGKLTELRNAVEEIGKTDEIRENISDLTAELNKMEWKVGIGVELSQSEMDKYRSDLESYVSETQNYIEQQHYSSTIAINMLFGEDSAEGQSIIDSFDKFFSSNQDTLSSLGEKLRGTISDAYKDGLLTFDEVEKINEIREQIAQVEAAIAGDKLDNGLSRARLNFSGKDITADSAKEYSNTVDETVNESIASYGEYRDTAVTTAKAAGADQATLDAIDDQYVNNVAYATTQGISAKTGIIYDAYNDSLSKGFDYWNNIDLSAFNNSIEFAEYDLQNGFSELMRSMNDESIKFYDAFNLSWGDNSAINDMWKQIEPDQAELMNTAEKYIEAGEVIPDSVRKGILDSAKVGAAIDDQESLYTLLAYNATLNNPGYSELISNAIKSGEDVPECVKLGVELAKPKTISEAEKFAQEIINKESETLENGKSDVEKAAESNAMSAGDGFKRGLDSILPEILQKANEFTSRLASALGVQATVTNSDGSKNTFAIVVNNADPMNTEIPLYPGQSALGGIYDSPYLTWVAEAGDAEAIIPLNASQRAYDLWLAAGEEISAARGDNVYTGRAPMYNMENETVTNSIIHNTTQKEIVIKLEGNAEIKIPKGLTKEEVLELLREHLEPMLLETIYIELFEGGDESFDT